MGTYCGSDRGQETLGISHLWFLKASVSTRFEVSEITEDTLFKLLHVPNGAPKSLKAEDECSDDIRASDVVKAAPQNTGDVFLVRQEEPIESRMR